MSEFVEIPVELFSSKSWGKRRIFSEAEAVIDLCYMTSKGKVNISCRLLADKWLWSFKKVDRLLKKVVASGWFEHSSTKLGSTLQRVSSDTLNDTLNDTLKPRYIKGFQEVDDTPNDTPSDTQEKKKENEKKNPPHPLKEKKNKKEKNERDLPAHAHTHEGEILIDPEEYELSFENFWRLYDKKVGKPNCEKKWNALSKSDRRAAIEYIPLYIAAQPDKQFRKNPQTFLNQKSWNDEIINRTYKPTAAENIAAAQEQCIRDCADMLAGRRYETVQDNLPF